MLEHLTLILSERNFMLRDVDPMSPFLDSVRMAQMFTQGHVQIAWFLLVWNGSFQTMCGVKDDWGLFPFFKLLKDANLDFDVL